MSVLSEAISLMNIIFSAILIFFVIVLISYHLYSELKIRTIRRVEEKFLKFINDGSDSAKQICNIKRLYTLNGIRALERLTKKLDYSQLDVLKDVLSAEKFLTFLRESLNSKKQSYAILATKLIIALEFNDFTSEIVINIYRWKENSEAQQISLLALFVNGCKKELVDLLTDPDFSLLLSFRTSQELVASYGGDKVDFLRTMMTTSCDNYIIRACILTAGNEKITELANLIITFLDAENLNLRITAIRALGKLKYVPAEERLVVILQESNWELVCAIVEALAKINSAKTYDIIFPFVFHEEWWVRYRTAEVLVSHTDNKKLLNDIMLSGDKFALEMVNYMIEKQALQKVREKNV